MTISMSEASDLPTPLNIYEETLNEETTCDMSSQGLVAMPDINNRFLCVLYLQNNKLTTLPDDFFPSLPSLMWLDLRDNRLTDIPKTIQNHQCLTHLLLQNNKLTSLPNELGSVVTLKVLQLSGNPLFYPPTDIINAGISKIIDYLHEKYILEMFSRSQCDISEDTVSNGNPQEYSLHEVSYNSVIDKKYIKAKTLCVQFNEKELEDSDEEYYGKHKGKCPKLAKSRHKILPCTQSARYLKALRADSLDTQNHNIKQNYLRERAIKKHKDLLATRDKILQERKNAELLRSWRTTYKYRQQNVDGSYRLESNKYPYDTNPEYMTLLTREDIEKDLPDKYKKKLVKKCKPSAPRKSNNDVHLALKIKQLFDKLEAIDINRDGLTPRTEQKVLMNEIQKISEIKQKLMELSTTNVKSVASD